MSKLLRRIDNAVCNRLLNCMDAVIDRKISGQNLVKYVPSIFRDDEQGVGGTGSQSTHYLLLKHIFSHVHLTQFDAFLDVGCGKGRVIAFLIREKCPCPICGIEYNVEVGKIANAWTERYKNARIIIGDALLQDYNPYTVLSLARSFLPKTFLAFVEHLEDSLTHQVTLIYWYDQESGYILNGRPGWKMLLRETIDRIHGLKIAAWPQSYSIWTYDPDRAGNRC